MQTSPSRIDRAVEGSEFTATAMVDRRETASNHSDQVAIAVHRGIGATTDGVRRALVSIGPGYFAQFYSEAEPPKPRVARQPRQRLPANWRKIRGKILAKVRNG
jgi:hypothetical protein